MSAANVETASLPDQAQTCGAVSLSQPAHLLDLADPHETLNGLIQRHPTHAPPRHHRRLQDTLETLKTCLFHLRQIEAPEWR